MISTKRLIYNSLDIKFRLGRYVVNVLTINYEPPVSGWGYGHHNHSGYELHYIPGGKGMLEANGRKYEIVPGTLYLTGPGVYHKQKADTNEPMSEYCINLELKQYRKQSNKEYYFLENELDEITEVWRKTFFWFGQDMNGTNRVFEDLLQELSHHYLGRFTTVQNLVSQILIKSARSFAENIEKDYPLPQKITNDRRRMIVDRFFADERNAPYTPDNLAGKIGVSVRQLNRIMLDYYSMTFKKKQTSFRMEQAKDLLRNTDLPVKDIAQKTGYVNESYFCKLFKESVSLTPTEYRTAERSV